MPARSAPNPLVVCAKTVIKLAALPSMPSGASSWTTVRRIATLTESANPNIATEMTAIQNHCDRPSNASEPAKNRAATMTRMPLRSTSPAMSRSVVPISDPADGAA